MNDSEEVRVEMIYGFSCARMAEHGLIVFPEPRNKLEAFWWAAQGFVHEVVIPALLFALAFTALKFAILP